MTALLLTLLLSRAPEACLQQYQTRYPESCPGVECPSSEAAACEWLANELSVDMGFSRQLSESILTPEMMEPTLATVGSASRAEAMTSVKPVGMFATSLSVSTSDPQEGALLTIAVNPLAISAETTGEFARSSRMADLKLVMPASLIQGTAPEFIGLSANFDFIAAARAQEAFSALHRYAAGMHEQTLVAGGELNSAIRMALNQTLKDNPEQRAACVEALFAKRPDIVAIDAACMTTLSAQLRPKALADSRFQRAVTRYREEAEREHGGLSVQLDVPTSPLSPKPFLASLRGSYSLRLAGNGAGWQARLSASASGDYHRQQTGQYALGGALAVSLAAEAKVLELGAIRISAGLKGHLGQTLAEKLQDSVAQTGRFLHGELGVHVPIGATGVALVSGMTWPILGEGAGRPFFSTSIDYSFLKGSRR